MVGNNVQVLIIKRFNLRPLITFLQTIDETPVQFSGVTYSAYKFKGLLYPVIKGSCL